MIGVYDFCGHYEWTFAWLEKRGQGSTGDPPLGTAECQQSPCDIGVKSRPTLSSGGSPDETGQWPVLPKSGAEQRAGEALLREFWDRAIHQDAQKHAADLIAQKGIQGMKEYWGLSLSQEGAGYKTTATEIVFRIDIHDCPSKGFLLRNQLEQHHDYCDHCIGWIGPMLKKSGFVIDHQHNHGGQCWWEMRPQSDQSTPSAPGELAKEHDVRLQSNWKNPEKPLDNFARANKAEDKS